MIQKFKLLIVKYLLEPLSNVFYKHITGYMHRSGFMLYAAHSSATSYTDAIYAISDDLPATYDAAGYAATTQVYTTIGRVQSFPEFGATRPVTEFVPITGAVEYLKGAPRYGQGPMVVADMPTDAGQVIVKAANDSAAHYSIKITYPDSEVHYLDVLIAGWQLSAASEGAVMTRTATIAVCKAPVIVAAS